MKKISRFFIALTLFVSLANLSLAAEEMLNPNHPDRYVVKKGDTLWDISGMFLRNPWLWPEIWHVNPQIANPHLIYPGDELNLVYIDGKPRLVLNRGPLKLSPGIRTLPLERAIPTLPIDAIAPFLTRPYVVDKNELEDKPYVVAFADEHIIGGAGQRLYVREIGDWQHKQFDIVRPGKAYKDADTGEVLGYEALYAGTGTLKRIGDPATIQVDRSKQEVLVGDRVLPFAQEISASDFHPKAPHQEINGSIIGVLNGVSQIGQHDVVILDRGTADGLESGTVLQINSLGETIPDKVAREARNLIPDVAEYVDPELVHHTGSQKWSTRSRWETVKLPDEEAGLLMVFLAYDRISFGLVMHATRAIHVKDRIVNP